MVVESTEAEVNGGGRIKSSSPALGFSALASDLNILFPSCSWKASDPSVHLVSIVPHIRWSWHRGYDNVSRRLVITSLIPAHSPTSSLDLLLPLVSHLSSVASSSLDSFSFFPSTCLPVFLSSVFILARLYPSFRHSLPTFRFFHWSHLEHKNLLQSYSRPFTNGVNRGLQTESQYPFVSF